MMFTNTKWRSKPHFFMHRGKWWCMLANSTIGYEVYLSLKWWYWADGTRV